jgi:hypothetical protein
MCPGHGLPVDSGNSRHAFSEPPAPRTGESPGAEIGRPGDETPPTVEAKGNPPVRWWWWPTGASGRRAGRHGHGGGAGQRWRRPGSGADGAESGRVQVGADPARLWRSPSRPTAIRSVSPSSGTDLDFTWEAAGRERASAPVCQASAHPARGRVPVRWGCPVHAESRRWSKAVERARRRKPHSSELAELTGTAKSE